MYFKEILSCYYGLHPAKILSDTIGLIDHLANQIKVLRLQVCHSSHLYHSYSFLTPFCFLLPPFSIQLSKVPTHCYEHETLVADKRSIGLFSNSYALINTKLWHQTDLGSSPDSLDYFPAVVKSCICYLTSLSLSLFISKIYIIKILNLIGLE